MSAPGLQGASETLVRQALDAGDPLPGSRGFAGDLDGTLVRDVLGRYPLFVEADAPDSWHCDPTELDEPTAVPPGHAISPSTHERVWTLPDPSPEPDPGAAVTAVKSALEAALGAVDTDSLAIGFSGGVDSALLAAALDAPLYVVGFPDSHDVEAARSAAAALDRDVSVVELDHDGLRAALEPVASAIRRTNAMDVTIALPLYVLAERVAADGYDRLALGQGADELFGGYAKIEKAPADPRVEADTVRGARREVLESLPDGLERDVLAMRAGGVEPVFPLLDDRVVAAALRLSGDQLVAGDGTRKAALRRAAGNWLPAEVAGRDKKALQYGSLVSRELDRLARQDGFKRRMDDHLGQWITAQTSLEE